MSVPPPATEQPGNSFRYLYWRLSEKRFQQLCGALLRHKYDHVQCYPVGMADGGIDAVAEGGVVYQVKWTSKVLQNPDTWLARAVAGEREKILRLVKEKRISRYILLTSVAGTTTDADSGSIQRLTRVLKDHSEELGVPIECWWQSDIDAEVDAAPDGIKWAFQEMLAGSDAIRYLIDGAQSDAQAARTRDMMRRVMATQWREDSKVKFSQVELDRVSLGELFIDVRLSVGKRQPISPGNREQEIADERQESLNAIEYLLRPYVRLAFLVGVPGQGKSTLGQYLCQMHRAALLPGDGTECYPHVAEPMFPLRVDLKDYAAWLSGFDPFGDDAPPADPRLRRNDECSLELYLAAFCTAHNGGAKVTVEVIQNLLTRFPALIVLDGLDEVADPALRAIVVEQIDAAVTRLEAAALLRRFQVLVTSRPTASGQAEPDKARFKTVRLEPLTAELQQQFADKWCDLKGIEGRDRRDLVQTFQHRSAHDHIAKLANNPMQLTILLYLINKKGDAVPTARTPLYTDYLDTLLGREVSRKQIDRSQVPQVQEITAFLGWYMQSGVEQNASAGRMTVHDIETVLLVYLHKTEGRIDDRERLFRAASDRFWALTSKVAGTFEFAVQPLREYFAAKFLAEWAGRDRREPLPKQVVLQHLIDRGYWLNTARFYAGFASPNELASLRYGLEEAIESGRHPLGARAAAWALLGDGIFAENARVQRDVVGLLTDDLTLVLAAAHPDTRVTFPRLARSNGGEHLVAELLRALERAPGDALALLRTTMLRNKSPLRGDAFAAWWTPHYLGAIGTSDESAWLDIGMAFGIRGQLPPAADRLPLDRVPGYIRAFLTGMFQVRGSGHEQQLLRAALDGWYTGSFAQNECEAGALLGAVGYDVYPEFTNMVRPDDAESWKALLKVNPAYQAMKQAADQPGSGHLIARELSRIHGPCWLAAELSIGSVGSPHAPNDHASAGPGEPFGNEVDYETLAFMVSRHSSDSEWWQDAHERYPDSLSRRTWALALVAIASPHIVAEHFEQLDACVLEQSADEFYAFASSVSRFALGRPARSLSGIVFEEAANASLRTKLVLTHFAADRWTSPLMPVLSDHELLGLARLQVPKHPVIQTITNRFLKKPSDELWLALVALGAPAPCEVAPDALPTVDTDLLEMLRHPGRYPASWVVAVENWHSRTHEEPSLDEVALDQCWVPRVPHL